MFFLALKNLSQEKTRLMISVGGVALSVALIMVLTGLYQGWRNKIGEYIRTVPADAWVMQSGSQELFHTPSVLPLSLSRRIVSVDGVKTAKPFSARRVNVEFKGEELSLYVVAFDSENDIGKPARVVEGKSSPAPGEIIIDVSQRNKVMLGDIIDVAQHELKVVGYSEGGDLVTSSFAFARKSDLDKIRELPGATNFFVVSTDRGADSKAVIKRIKRDVPGVDAVSKSEFVDNNTKIITDTFLPVILVLLLISAAVGVAVIGLTIFTSTIEKAREYGVLKAIGLRNRQLYIIVIEQAVVAGVIGFVVGTGLAFSLGATVGRAVPQFVSQIRLIDVAAILGLTLAMSVLAAYIPMRRLARIDPAEVFKA